MKLILFAGLIVFGFMVMFGDAAVVQDTLSNCFFLGAGIIVVIGMFAAFKEACTGNKRNH